MSQSVRRNTHAVVQSALESALEFQSEGPEHPQPSPTHTPIKGRLDGTKPVTSRAGVGSEGAGGWGETGG